MSNRVEQNNEPSWRSSRTDRRLSRLTGCIYFLSVGLKQKPILNGFFDTTLRSPVHPKSLPYVLLCCGLAIDFAKPFVFVYVIVCTWNRLVDVWQPRKQNSRLNIRTRKNCIHVYITLPRNGFSVMICKERESISNFDRHGKGVRKHRFLRKREDAIIWKHFPRYWPFVRGIHRSPVNSTHKDQWRGALMFSLICTWINGWVNNGKAGDFRRHRAHYDVTVMHFENLRVGCNQSWLCPRD